MQLTSSDGLVLHVAESGPRDAPTVLAVHGYPDDSTLWDAVAAQLQSSLRVVRYDVRGAGRSAAPASRDGYLLEQLVADLRLVADAVSPDAPVHLLAHDWGAVQGWHAVCTDWAPQRFASFTAMSGAHLDSAAAWVRAGGPAQRRQARMSWYIGFFKLPILPELAWRTGAFRTVVARTEGRAVAAASSTADGIRGLELYRANMGIRRHRPPEPTEVPTQLIVPRGDRYLTEELQRANPVTDPLVHVVDGGHWIARTDPARVAGLVADFVRTAGAAPR